MHTNASEVIVTTRVLFVEDDKKFAESVIQFLELNGLIVDYCHNGRMGLNLLADNQYDVIVSDINMPKLNGLNMCQAIREQGIDTPLILLTALSHLNDKITGFEHGADDYLTKPFEMRELVARVLALSKRRSGKVAKLSIAELQLELNLDKHTATRQNQAVQLTPSSWRILETLARAYPKAVSKRDLEYVIWGEDAPDGGALKVHIHRLRQRLDKPFDHPLVQIVSGFGVKLALGRADGT